MMTLLAFVAGAGELMILVAILLVIFGASNMAEYGGNIRKAVTNFRSYLQGKEPEDEEPESQT